MESRVLSVGGTVFISSPSLVFLIHICNIIWRPFSITDIEAWSLFWVVGRGGSGCRLSLDGDVARASRRQLEGIDEDTFVRVTGVEGEHAVVDVLLQALAVVARSKGTASGFGEEAGFDALGLGVSGPGVVLDNDAPFTISVLSAQGTGVLDVARADESLAANPVSLIELLAVVE